MPASAGSRSRRGAADLGTAAALRIGEEAGHGEIKAQKAAGSSEIVFVEDEELQPGAFAERGRLLAGGVGDGVDCGEEVEVRAEERAQAHVVGELSPGEF